jgi:hypothetical protein
MVMIKMATYEETMEALEGAIKKWEKIYAGVGIDDGVDNCPLCELFDGAYDCTGCPVDYVTNEGCQGGPYSDWYWHHRYSHDSAKHPFIIECAKCTEIALNMINYLKSLRPKVDEMFYK